MGKPPSIEQQLRNAKRELKRLRDTERIEWGKRIEAECECGRLRVALGRETAMVDALREALRTLGRDGT